MAGGWGPTPSVFKSVPSRQSSLPQDGQKWGLWGVRRHRVAPQFKLIYQSVTT